MMAPSRKPWFRFYVEVLQDPKLLNRPYADRVLWPALMCLARTSPVPGHLVVTEGVASDEELIAAQVNMKVDEVRSGLAYFAGVGMVAKDAVGAWYLPHFLDRQYESDNSTDRVSRHRAKEQCNGQSALHLPTMQQPASVNRSQIPETELSPSLAVSQEGPDEGPLVKGDVATLRALLLPRLAGAGEGDVAPQLGGDQGRSVSLDRLARVTDRLVRLCTGNSLDFVRREASEVVAWASTSLDLNVIDEVVGSAGEWKDRPTLPRAVAGPIRKRAKQLGIPMREFLPKQRLNAAS